MQKKQVIQIGVIVSALAVSAWLAIDMVYPSSAPENNQVDVSPVSTETKVIPPPERVEVPVFVEKQRVISDQQLLHANEDFDSKLRQLRASGLDAVIAENKAVAREAALRGKPAPEKAESDPEPAQYNPYQQLGMQGAPAQLSLSGPVERTKSAYEDAVLSYFDFAAKQAYLAVSGATYKAYPGLTIDDLKVASINKDGVWISKGNKRRLLTGNQTYSLPQVVISKEETESSQQTQPGE